MAVNTWCVKSAGGPCARRTDGETAIFRTWGAADSPLAAAAFQFRPKSGRLAAAAAAAAVTASLKTCVYATSSAELYLFSRVEKLRRELNPVGGYRVHPD